MMIKLDTAIFSGKTLYIKLFYCQFQLLPPKIGTFFTQSLFVRLTNKKWVKKSY